MLVSFQRCCETISLELHLLTVLLAQLRLQRFVLLPYLSLALTDDFIYHLLLNLLGLQVPIFV